MQVSVMTPSQIVFTGEASEVVLNAFKGQLDILDRHADLMTEVKPGLLRIKSTGATREFEVSDGVLRIHDGKCAILCMEASEKRAA